MLSVDVMAAVSSWGLGREELNAESARETRRRASGTAPQVTLARPRATWDRAGLSGFVDVAGVQLGRAVAGLLGVWLSGAAPT